MTPLGPSWYLHPQNLRLHTGSVAQGPDHPQSILPVSASTPICRFFCFSGGEPGLHLALV